MTPTPRQGAARGARNARKRACGPTARTCTRWQFERVHRGVAYNLELDTSRLMPACARLIQQRFKL
ncbi:phosphotransferase-like protein [Mesorhizobium sp. CA14]|uniref:phosphotransferase-like protein n=1 Tax=Mesorhizobium sp. CA14 TaxID=2876642 RepID=UPI0029624FA9|nr:hypothetical protein [Mesorhizobium sp. CA14]